MLRTTCCGFVPLCLLALALLLGNPAGPPAEARRRVNCEGTTVVCPVFSWGYFGGFYYYLAFDCLSNTTVGLASVSPLPLCNCAQADCTEKCINYGDPGYGMKEKKDEAVKVAKAPKGVRLGDTRHFLKEGIDVGAEPRKTLLKPADEYLKAHPDLKSVTEVGKPSIVRLYLDRGNSKSVLVALHTIKVVPKDNVQFSTREFRIGYEVKEGTDIDSIRWEKIRKGYGKCIRVDYDGNDDYLVILGKETQDPDEKVDARAMPKGERK